MAAVILRQHPVGQLLKKAAVLDGQNVRLAVLPPGEEQVILCHVPPGEILGEHRVAGAVLDGKGGGLFVQSGNAEGRAGGFLLVGDQRAGLEPCPQGGNGGLYFGHGQPPQNVVTALAP